VEGVLSKFPVSPISLLLLLVAGFILGNICKPFFSEMGKDLYVWLKHHILKRNPKESSSTLVAPVIQMTSAMTGLPISPAAVPPLPAVKTAYSRVERISQVTFQEVRDAYDNAPPFQQSQITHHYDGVRVEWEGNFNSVTPRNELVTVRMYATDKLGSGVNFIVAISDYPELKTMLPGRRIRVLGTIKLVDTLSIELVDAEMTVLS
jgi:hypothetical protein